MLNEYKILSVRPRSYYAYIVWTNHGVVSRKKQIGIKYMYYIISSDERGCFSDEIILSIECLYSLEIGIGDLLSWLIAINNTVIST